MSEHDLPETEIEAIRTAAANLPLVEPPRDLWPGIEARLGARVMDIATHKRRRPRGLVVSTRMLASAAAVLVIATAGTTYLVLRDMASPSGGMTALGTGSAAADESGLVSRASLTVGGELGAYTQEIGDLQAVIGERRARLDPATIAVIERNLRVIDGAIEESKRALANDPHSGLLTALLSEALAKKVRLLRQAALLPPLT